MLKVRPFQNHRLRGKNRFDGLKNFGAPQNEENLIFGAQKNEKIDFFKKREVCDFTEHWGSFPQWVGSICSISRSRVNSFDIDFGLG